MESLLHHTIQFFIQHFYDSNLWSIRLPRKPNVMLPLDTQQKISLIRNDLSSMVQQPVDSGIVDCLMSVIFFHVPNLFKEVLELCKTINRHTTTHEWSFQQIRNAWVNHTLTVDRLVEISMEEFDHLMADMKRRLRQAQKIHGLPSHDNDDDHGEDGFVVVGDSEDEEKKNRRTFKEETRIKSIELIPLYCRLFSVYQISTFTQFNRLARHETRNV